MTPRLFLTEWLVRGLTALVWMVRGQPDLDALRLDDRSDQPRLNRPIVLDSANRASQPAPPPPESLLHALRGDPFGGQCKDAEHRWWPFPVTVCDYQIDGRTLEVTTATPPPDRVARWLVDAMAEIPAARRLEEASPAEWEESLRITAGYVMGQSGRAFPVDGTVFENFEGPTDYSFRGGVTFGVDGEKSRSCSACACRIASLHREEWCNYQARSASEGGTSEPADYAGCMHSLGGPTGWSDAWANRCLQIHADAWNSDSNQGFRALFQYVQRHQLEEKISPSSSPAEIVLALKKAFEFPHRAR